MTPAVEQILAVILGGGRGSRLYPLTRQRSKPAVPIAGKYRLIDIPLSNCINSGIYRVAVLTQFNSVSLNRHISQAYRFDVFHTGWVQIWAAEQTMVNSTWYQGTADAVRKQLFEIKAARAEYLLILAGDHLYRMDYAPMFQFLLDNNADVVVAVQPAPTREAGRLGILKRGADMRITDFAEKPKDPETLQRMVSRDDSARPYLGSMGIYLFKTSALVDLLENSTFDDFGGHVIPAAIRTHRVCGYDFEGYWEDIGTIRSFYETNLALAGPHPPFEFTDPANPIYTHARFLPGSTVINSKLDQVLLCEGSYIENAEITHAVVGVRSQIHRGTVIRDSVLMGSDYYEHPGYESTGSVSIGIGSNCQIENAIIDKNARIGHDTVIRAFPKDAKDIDCENWFLRDGIVVIPKDVTLPPKTYIGPDMPGIEG